MEQVRLDATTMSGNHLVSESGLFQFGHSKDHPSLPQIKVMLASLDPLGMPLATKIVSGEKADDGLYIPIFDQVSQNLEQSELLWVGDCKMSSQKTRGHIHRQQHYYLTPLSLMGRGLALVFICNCACIKLITFTFWVRVPNPYCSVVFDIY